LLNSFWIRIGRDISLPMKPADAGLAEFDGLEELVMNAILHVGGKDSAKTICWLLVISFNLQWTMRRKM